MTYDLTIYSTAGGSVTTPSEETSTHDGSTVVDLVAEAEEGYRFVNWTGYVDTIGNVHAASITITMNGDYSISANFGEEEVVTFPDPNLETAMREAIGKPTGDIYQSDLDRLISLDASTRNIANLTGLEHCINLTHLDLWHNQISDISSLTDLTNLKDLWLHSK